jgi:hypothetical protein
MCGLEIRQNLEKGEKTMSATYNLDFGDYGVKSWSIVGFTFEADTVCRECMLKHAKLMLGEIGDIDLTEAMTRWAAMVGVDPSKEGSYDSGVFPKVIFASDSDDESCGNCHRKIDDTY